MSETRARDAAATAWGYALPDWVAELADQCDLLGQREAAKRIGFSSSTVNEVVRNNYKARNKKNVEDAVRGAFMGATVQCPVLDEIARDLCLVNQKMKFSTANPVRVALSRRCPTCPNNRNAKKLLKPEEKSS